MRRNPATASEDVNDNMNTKWYLLPPSVFLLLASSQALAQEPSCSNGGQGGFRTPSQEDMAKEQAKAREVMGRLPADLGTIKQQYGGGMPKIDALPQPATKAPDINQLAEKYKQLGRATVVAQSTKPDLMVLVSFSMPKEALLRTIHQADPSGPTPVFRGLKGDSMMKMGEEIKSLIGKRNVSIAIHPPAFQQFSVTRVPAVVIARGEAGNVMDNGCSKPGTFVKVTGDVTLDYALDYIERKSPAWASEARFYRSKIVRGIN